jgi:hypothetical protein
LLEENARIARELKYRLCGAYCVWGLGKANALRGKPIRAARLWGAAESLRDQRTTYRPDFSSDGTKIAYTSVGKQSSNPEGAYQVYHMNATDGSGEKNLSNNAAEYDVSPEWGR